MASTTADERRAGDERGDRGGHQCVLFLETHGSSSKWKE